MPEFVDSETGEIIPGTEEEDREEAVNLLPVVVMVAVLLGFILGGGAAAVFHGYEVNRIEHKYQQQLERLAPEYDTLDTVSSVR